MPWAPFDVLSTGTSSRPRQDSKGYTLRHLALAISASFQGPMPPTKTAAETAMQRWPAAPHHCSNSQHWTHYPKKASAVRKQGGAACNGSVVHLTRQGAQCHSVPSDLHTCCAKGGAGKSIDCRLSVCVWHHHCVVLRAHVCLQFEPRLIS